MNTNQIFDFEPHTGRWSEKWEGSHPTMSIRDVPGKLAELAGDVTTVLDYRDLCALSGSVLYAWVRGQELLYVGISGVAASRIFNHTVIGADEPLLPGDYVLAWSADAIEDLLETEAQIIERFRPRLNDPIYSKPGQSARTIGVVLCRHCQKEFQQRRYWQKYCSGKCKYSRKPVVEPGAAQ